MAGWSDEARRKSIEVRRAKARLRALVGQVKKQKLKKMALDPAPVGNIQERLVSMADWKEAARYPNCTLLKYWDESTRSFTKERAELHVGIVGRTLVQAQMEGAMSRPHGHRQFIMMGGGMAVGKSSIAQSDKSPTSKRRRRGTVKVAADDYMVDLPDYEELKHSSDDWEREHAAWLMHEEVGALAKVVQDIAEDSGFDVLLDGLGDSTPQRLRGKIGKARSKGYKVAGIYATCDLDESFKRDRIRAEQDPGRVPSSPVAIAETHRDVARAVVECWSDYDEFELWDTTRATADGSVSPVLVARAEKGQLKIENDELWRRFLRKQDIDPTVYETPEPYRTMVSPYSM